MTETALHIASAAYLYILEPKGELSRQHVLCLLRDFIAQETDGDAQEIQDTFTAQASRQE